MTQASPPAFLLPLHPADMVSNKQVYTSTKLKVSWLKYNISSYPFTKDGAREAILGSGQ